MNTYKKQNTNKIQNNKINRRRFIAGAGSAALLFPMIKPDLIRGSQANSKTNLGVIGCGNRGTWIADLFMKHGGYNIVAGADYFQDRVDEFGDKYNVSQSRRFTGLSCYKKLLDSGVDAVAIESPPYFHPEQAMAAVNAGAHVYVAKPIAVDVPGCNTIAEAGKKATEKKLCMIVDFQTRTSQIYKEAIKRVQFGEIGRIITGEASYHCGTLARFVEYYKDANITSEDRLRGWAFDKILSGDVITEQNIHALDVAAWILDANPVDAVGKGGQYRSEGNCWDHFSVIFTFPNDVIVTFNSKQLGKGFNDIMCRMYGETGTIDTDYTGSVSIRGDRPYKGGKMINIFTEGAKTNIADFYTNITQERYANTTVRQSVRSNLTTILGRTAAYRSGLVTWNEMINANEKLNPKLYGLKS